MDACKYIGILITCMDFAKICALNNGMTKTSSDISKPIFDSLKILNLLNCTPFIPITALQMMQNYTQQMKTSNQIQSEWNTIPYAYLVDCIVNAQYDKRVSPFIYSDTNKMRVELALSELIGLDFIGDLSFFAHFHLTWTEQRLRWPLESDIEFWKWHNFTFSVASIIWLPIFRVRNCAGEKCTVRIDNSSLIFKLTNSGQVDIYFNNVLESSCELDLQEFPFDIQYCSMVLALSNDDSQGTVSLEPGDIVYADFRQNSREWTVASLNIANSSYFDTRVYAFKEYSPSNWSSARVPTTFDNSGSIGGLIIQLTLARNSAIYVYNLLVPLFVIAIIAVLAVLYPSSKPEKPIMLVHVLVAFTIYQLLLSDKNPQSKEMPYIGVYIMLSMALMGINQFSSSFILRLHLMNKTSKPPNIIRLLLIRTQLTFVKIELLFKALIKKICCIKKVDLNSEGMSNQNGKNPVLYCRFRNSFDIIFYCKFNFRSF